VLRHEVAESVVGPGFRELHVLLEELAHLAMGASDSVAERAITLGHHPDCRAARSLVRISCLRSTSAPRGTPPSWPLSPRSLTP
jgi:DNA-binding ferritin-like protein